MNTCIVTGNLGADPESFFSDEGTHIVSFPLAFRSTKKDKTNWIKVVCFQKQAEAAEKYLHKGAKVSVNSRLDQNKWVDDSNQTRSTFRLIANQIEFIKTDGRGFDNGQNHESQDQAPPDMDEAPF